MNVRDWLYVADNCSAIDLVLHKGKIGEVYNIGGSFEIPNIELTKIILKNLGKTDKMINYVPDRLGHDRRYSMDSSKVRKLGWKPSKSFDTAIKETGTKPTPPGGKNLNNLKQLYKVTLSFCKVF